MTNEPNDDVFRNLAKVMEDIITGLHIDENARFIGCTIISGPGGDPRIFQTDEQDEGHEEPEYEIIDGSDKLYVTLELPPDLDDIPGADIQPDMIRVSIDDMDIDIPLPSTVDTGKSFYNVNNGVLDIICEKIL
ncbi:heat-shock protein Hsp90 [Methanoplanus sp. FWC-SCC4]|uniref:Heat-shock protein Hsp90 n=1 Tax=Methanochimaera problematica TaxID=2609417 RepID=A0AA97FBC1_9EURY|nr:Hsp20/alpha crystallin family protein [Methanoplanus sp. FWC-SCC4]WOF15422.1 heat-shock protein Hsp90 [Methanoplanus sp. FWC-SCC4]